MVETNCESIDGWNNKYCKNKTLEKHFNEIEKQKHWKSKQNYIEMILFKQMNKFETC